MHRLAIVSLFAVSALWLATGTASAQTRPATPPAAVPSSDEIKLDESGAPQRAAPPPGRAGNPDREGGPLRAPQCFSLLSSLAGGAAPGVAARGCAGGARPGMRTAA